MKKPVKSKSAASAIAAKSNAPIPLTSLHKLKLIIKTCRIENKLLKTDVAKLKKWNERIVCKYKFWFELWFYFIIANTGKSKKLLFMKRFWEKQQKHVLVSTKSSIRYNPMIIQYFLALIAKSSAANKKGRCVRDYKNTYDLIRDLIVKS